MIGPNHEGETTFKTFNDFPVDMKPEQAYSVGTELASTALCAAVVTLHLSPKEKRKVFLEIANPRPNAEGVIRTRISLFHAERHIKSGRAVRVNDQMQLDPDGAWLAFKSFVNAGRTVTADWLNNQCVNSATPIPARVRTAAEVAADQRAIQLWPVLPNYTEGRPMEDFLATVAHAAHTKASKTSANGSSVRP